MNTIKEQFHALVLERRLSKRSLTDSFHQALHIAGLQSSDGDATACSQLLYSVSQQVLDLLERKGQEKSVNGTEPAYHNRQHFADAVLALSLLISQINIFSEEDKRLLLLAMLVHDYEHRGINNHPPRNMTHEEESVALLKNTAISKLPSQQQDKIDELIIGTTIKTLKDVNLRHQQDPRNIDYLMQALMNDADIICSFIPSLGPRLTRDILLESGNSAPSQEEINAAYLEFQKHFSLTTDLAKLIC